MFSDAAPPKPKDWPIVDEDRTGKAPPMPESMKHRSSDSSDKPAEAKSEKIELDEGRDRSIWEGWFEEAKKCDVDDGSLQKFIDHLANDYNHSYGTYAHSAAAAAYATANALAKKFGLTGFQWGYTGMEIVGRMLCPHNKSGIRLLDYDDLLYPQYEDRFLEHKISEESAEELKKEAQKLIDEHRAGMVAPVVLKWWEKIAKGEFPKWLAIKKRKES